jgi:hypothetical protein
VKKIPPARLAMRALMLPCLLSPLIVALTACSTTEEPDPSTQVPPPTQSSFPPPEAQSEWEHAQISSTRTRVIEYDGDDRDSRASTGGRGGGGQLDEDLGGTGMSLSPMGGWIRN